MYFFEGYKNTKNLLWLLNKKKLKVNQNAEQFVAAFLMHGIYVHLTCQY